MAKQTYTDKDTGSTIEKVLLTPEVALIWLKSNYNLRKPSKVTWKKYAADITRGEWNESIVSPIKFDKDGRMIDGQHRCYAVIDAKKPIWVYVQRNLDDYDRHFMDIGRSRKASDLTTAPNARQTTALATRVLCTTEGGAGLTVAASGMYPDHSRPSAAHVALFANDHYAEWLRFINGASKMRKRMKKGSHVTYAFALWLIDYLGRGENLDLFIDDFSSAVSEDYNLSWVKNSMRDEWFSKDLTTREELSYILAAYEYYGKARKIKSAKHIDQVFAMYDELLKNKRKSEQDEV